jgi:broad specificity phosphatase PhoE
VVSMGAWSDERILMVTHAGVIRVLIAMCTQCDERDIQVDYGEVIELLLPTTKELLDGIG